MTNLKQLVLHSNAMRSNTRQVCRGNVFDKLGTASCWEGVSHAGHFVVFGGKVAAGQADLPAEDADPLFGDEVVD